MPSLITRIYIYWLADIYMFSDCDCISLHIHLSMEINPGFHVSDGVRLLNVSVKSVAVSQCLISIHIGPSGKTVHSMPLFHNSQNKTYSHLNILIYIYICLKY